MSTKPGAGQKLLGTEKIVVISSEESHYKWIVHFPMQKSALLAQMRRPERILLICYFDPLGVSNVSEIIACMEGASKFAISVLNLYEERYQNSSTLHPNLDLNGFAAIIIHNTVSYEVDTLKTLDIYCGQKLRDFRGVKVMMKQDENYKFREIAAYLRKTDFDLVLTCLREDDIPKIYPAEFVGKAQFEPMLTGYITPRLRNFRPDATPKLIDIGYRGSIQPLEFGRLAYEKRKIGDDVSRFLAGRGLRLDISSRWEDRFGGDSWLEFLASCKATLGTESGASIFDLSGRLFTLQERAQKKLGQFREDSEYAELYLSELAELEGGVNYAQISPRHFEAAATKTLQVLYPGSYSNILTDRRHYVSLRRDYENLDAVVDLILDDVARSRITEAAYEEIVLDRRFWIETFVQRLDDLLEEKLHNKSLLTKSRSSSVAAAHALILALHSTQIDPRIGWIATGAHQFCKIHQLGLLNKGAFEHLTETGSFNWGVPRRPWVRGDSYKWLKLVKNDSRAMAAILQLEHLENLLDLPHDKFCQLFSAPLEHPSVHDFRWYLQLTLDGAATLIDHALSASHFSVIIATDLLSLPAALVIGGIFRAPVLFDAHEYWPECSTKQLDFERKFWQELQNRLVKHTAYCQTVSPGLANLMSEETGVDFECVPNCVPRNQLLLRQKKALRSGEQTVFLFQGGFSPHRGVELLIKGWPSTDPRAILMLRGPDGDFKNELIELAKLTGLLGSRIHFPPAVSEENLIEAASEADVGVIPYVPVNKNHEHCSPNKLSQYMAAGLPILANRTSFVSRVIKEADCGVIVNFNNTENLISAVAYLINDSAARTRMGISGQAFFAKRFHWEVVSRPLYDAINFHTQDQTAAVLSIYEESSERSTSVHPSKKINFAQAQYGAQIIGSSAFHTHPHDPSFLLEPDAGEGYAAGVEGKPQWIEIDLGRSRRIDSFGIEWLDRFHYGIDFCIEARSDSREQWDLLLAIQANQEFESVNKISLKKMRYIRISGTAFAGQNRMLIRRLYVWGPALPGRFVHLLRRLGRRKRPVTTDNAVRDGS